MSYRGLRLTALSVVLGTALTAFAAGGSNVGASTPTGPTGVIRLATDTPPDPWDPALATPNDPNMLYYQGPYDFSSTPTVRASSARPGHQLGAGPRR